MGFAPAALKLIIEAHAAHRFEGPDRRRTTQTAMAANCPPRARRCPRAECLLLYPGSRPTPVHILQPCDLLQETHLIRVEFQPA